MKTKGFTLIELMIVLAIIAILAAIFVPVIQGKKPDSSTSCSNCNSPTNGRMADNSEFDQVKFDGPYVNVYRTHDNKKNVTCWSGSSGNSMSCIPDQLINPIGQ